MGYKFTSICCNGASLTTVHEPEDHGVSIAPSPLFSSRHVSEIHLGLIKLLLASLLWQSKYPLLSQHPQRWTKRPCPAASLGSFIGFSRCSDSRGHIPLLYSRKTFSTRRPPFPTDGTGHARSGGSMAEEPLCQATLSPAEPSGEGCATTGRARDKQRGMSEAKEKTHNPTHGMSLSLSRGLAVGMGSLGTALIPSLKHL